MSELNGDKGRRVVCVCVWGGGGGGGEVEMDVFRIVVFVIAFPS